MLAVGRRQVWLMRRLGHRLFFALLILLAAAAAFALGAGYRVMKAESWVECRGPDGSWAGLFPTTPVMRAGPAPDPFRGEMRTWTASTDTASFEVAALAPQAGGRRQDAAGPQEFEPMAFAAVAANALKGRLEIVSQGRFKIHTPESGVVYGRVVRDAEGNLFRLLAAGGEGGTQAAELFLNEFRVRGGR